MQARRSFTTIAVDPIKLRDYCLSVEHPCGRLYRELSVLMNPIHLLDVVAITTDLPESGLVRGQVGTVVEVLDSEAYEVEFSDEEGRSYAQVPLRADRLLVLHYQPQYAA
jgi:hypothetical protein